MNWFDVDKKGLSEIVARRGKTFVIFELLQNALDCDGTTRVDIALEPVAGLPLAKLLVVDNDPDGFKDLSHAYTLFAPSAKKSDAGKRGRFNLGEKLVLALCEEAEIVSTTGGVRFDAKGRHAIRRRRVEGSEFIATVKMTRDEYREVMDGVRKILPPPNVEILINGSAIEHATPLRTFRASLLTEVTGGDGVVEPEILRRVMRPTALRIYLARHSDDGGWLFELGIPVCPTGDRWHVDIGQKIPLNMERDGVPAGYLKTVRTLVVNAMHEDLTSEDVRKPWVQNALEDPRIEAVAVRAITEKQHGRGAVAFDPSDIEGTYISQAKGTTVVPGGTYSKEAWENIRKAEALPPAGQVTPSKPSSFAETEYLRQDDLTPAMKRFQRFAVELIGEILHLGATRAVFLRSPDASVIADWSSGPDDATVRFNVGHPQMGEAWFEGPLRWDHVDLIIHELAHHGGHHLASGYHELISKAAGKTALLALTRPEIFDLGRSRS